MLPFKRMPPRRLMTSLFFVSLVKPVSWRWSWSIDEEKEVDVEHR
jgi:hypothetical protein